VILPTLKIGMKAAAETKKAAPARRPFPSCKTAARRTQGASALLKPGVQLADRIARRAFAQAWNKRMKERRHPRAEKRKGERKGDPLVLKITFTHLSGMRQKQALKHATHALTLSVSLSALQTSR
jgi:hypothetical protein